MLGIGQTTGAVPGFLCLSYENRHQRFPAFFLVLCVRARFVEEGLGAFGKREEHQAFFLPFSDARGSVKFIWEGHAGLT